MAGILTHYTLTSCHVLQEDLEVKKDTERADEIRAMKKAWEDAEPGRAAKALQSRQQYLNKNMIKVRVYISLLLECGILLLVLG